MRQQDLMKMMMEKDRCHQQLMQEHVSVQSRYISQLEQQVCTKDQYLHDYGRQMLDIIGSRSNVANCFQGSQQPQIMPVSSAE